MTGIAKKLDKSKTIIILIKIRIIIIMTIVSCKRMNRINSHFFLKFLNQVTRSKKKKNSNKISKRRKKRNRFVNSSKLRNNLNRNKCQVVKAFSVHRLSKILINVCNLQ